MSEADDPAEAEIDSAVAAARIDPSERETWRRRFRELDDFAFARETLNALPADPERGARSFEHDRRLRSLTDAYLDYLGIPEEYRGEREYDDGPRSIESQWLAYCGLEGGA